MRLGAALLVAVVAALAACSEPVSERFEPRQLDAVYRLLFNDDLVGHALFSLRIDRDGHYRIEAFTTPAGKIAEQPINEVLEVSEGTVDGAGVYPSYFDHSVLLGDGYRHVRIDFDWETKALEVSHGDARQTLALLGGTQDRLSYLLAGAQLSRGASGDSQTIRLASLEATEPAELKVIGHQTVSVPHGTFEATGIQRLSDEHQERREIWYAAESEPLPLQLLRQHDGNTIQMQLESLTAVDVQPVPD